MARIPPEEVQKRFDRLTEILGGIVEHADTQASTRCPYRDRHDRCTAKFRCRNQKPADDVLLCTHDGVFDYRDAWESDPRTGEDARRRIETIRTGASRRRSSADGGEGGGQRRGD